ncbi:MAG: hypothetical protein COB60_03735 [Flavobacteriaceae bacterium]|nr:MAG: hypothetical protein COB60_03735 [Flavobacteriaceae bacterium]
MTIKELQQLLLNKKETTTQKKEANVYSEFSKLLEHLSLKEIAVDEITLIEQELSVFLQSKGVLIAFKLFKKQVSKFKQFLQNKFQFVPQHYYMQHGIAVGLCFGVAFGSIFNIGLGISFGMFAGIIVGKFLDQKAAQEGRVLG